MSSEPTPAGAGRGADADVAIVGPTHPHVGGIAQHSTRLAHELARSGMSTVIESWRAQYPAFLRKGLGELPRDRPEIPPYAHVRERLAWYSPLSWWRAGRRARRSRLVILTVVTPFHAVPYAGILAAAGRRVRRAVIVHNVLPHEASPVDRVLQRALLRRVDRVIVHSDAQRSLAEELGVRAERVSVTTLPFPGLGAEPPAGSPPRLEGAARLNLLFFGMVRPYKGLDVLLRALAQAPTAHLRVVGHFWEPLESYTALASELGVADRVDFIPGYVDAAEIPGHFARADALVLPYRSGTASIVGELARAHGRPAIVTSVGTLADAVLDGQTGIVVPPESPAELAVAIERLADPAELERMVAAVRTSPDQAAEAWAAYAALIRTELDAAPSGLDARR